VGVAEGALLLVSACVVLVGLVGMLTALLIGLNERRREMAILRSVGARPAQVLALIVGEAALLTLLGLLAGVALLYALLIAGQPLLQERLGLFIGIGAPTPHEWLLLGAVLMAGVVAGALPALRAYWMSLADGLSVRV
jgi:putative ABC transport system permease protein